MRSPRATDHLQAQTEGLNGNKKTVLRTKLVRSRVECRLDENEKQRKSNNKRKEKKAARGDFVAF